jgi:UDP-N-acetylmuramate dehydrogenase
VLETDSELTIIGGGSNLIPRRRVRGTVLRCSDQTFKLIHDDAQGVLIEVGAGYDWNALVETTITRGWTGIENLVLIPGTVGGAPMQNIGAYGVELKDRFHSLVALNRHSAEWREFGVTDCEFGYRSSVFKTSGDWIISRVRLRLGKGELPVLTYPEVAKRMAGAEPTAALVASTIRAIRLEKLPDPTRIGNVGSFFKNPVISKLEAAQLKERYPWLQVWQQTPLASRNAGVKLAAAQLIERAGWKGYEENGVGVWASQPLVLVNRGTRAGSAFLALAAKIRTDLHDRYGISLELEPVVIGQD